METPRPSTVTAETQVTVEMAAKAFKELGLRTLQEPIPAQTEPMARLAVTAALGVEAVTAGLLVRAVTVVMEVTPLSAVRAAMGVKAGADTSTASTAETSVKTDRRASEVMAVPEEHQEMMGTTVPCTTTSATFLTAATVDRDSMP